MTRPECDQVTERVAMGEELAELAPHAASCERCRRLLTASSQLAATHHAVDPGLGFSARMTVGAQHRIAVRRRRRIAGGFAATALAGALGVVVVTRAPDDATHEPMNRPAAQLPEQPSEPASDDDLAALAELADVDGATRASADWAQIEKPLRPYRKLVQGVTP